MFNAWTSHGNATTNIVPYEPGLDTMIKPSEEQKEKALVYKISPMKIKIIKSHKNAHSANWLKAEREDGFVHLKKQYFL